MEFVIDRSKWFRGQGPNGSSLLRKDHTQCCVGQMCSQLGLPNTILLGESTVNGLFCDELVDGDLREKLSPLADIDAEKDWVEVAYTINDSRDIDDTEREKQLQELVAPHGHTLRFVDSL
jgi:hypothetical protein